MADFKVEKVTDSRRLLPEQYTITYYRDALSDSGETVNVEHRKERVTLEQLQKQLVEIQAKIDAIGTL